MSEQDRIRASQQAGEQIEAAYDEPCALWMLARGCVTMDLTPEQLERFAAWQRSHNDVVWAGKLVYLSRTLRQEVGR